MKEANITYSDGEMQVRLCCEIDHHTAKIIREEVDRELLLRRPEKLILDFSGVSFMDSSGIGLILGRVNKADEICADIVIRSLSPTLKRIVKMSGIERLPQIKIV